MRKTFASLIAISTIAFASVTLAERPQLNGHRVAAITIEGNDNLSDSELLALMKTKPDESFDESVFSKDIESLYKTGSFTSVRPTFIADASAQTVRIKIAMQEKETYLSIRFHGNRVYSDKQLLQTSGLVLGKNASATDLLNAKDRIVDQYKLMNYVDPRVEIYTDAQRSITFKVNEGKRKYPE